MAQEDEWQAGDLYKEGVKASYTVAITKTYLNFDWFEDGELISVEGAITFLVTEDRDVLVEFEIYHFIYFAQTRKIIYKKQEIV